jgi:hypothetical protein
MTQKKIIQELLSTGQHIRGSDVWAMSGYRVSEPSFKRIVHELRLDGVVINFIKIKPRSGGRCYYSYYMDV